MKIKKFIIRTLFIIFISFIITALVYILLLSLTTFNDSPEEVSCVHGTAGKGTSGSGFSNGIWRADNPWNLIIGQSKGDTIGMNCDCGLWGNMEYKFNDKSQPICVYYNEGWINNKEYCNEKGLEYLEFNSGGKVEGICLCTFEQRKSNQNNCLLDLAWEEYQKDRAKGMWSKNEVGGLLLPHIITFMILYIFIFIFLLIAFLFIGYFRKKNI